RDGVEVPPAHASCLAMLAPVMTLDEGARIYSPGGELLQAGQRLHQPGLVAALESFATEGAETCYRGTIAESLLALCSERDGLITRDDLESYAPRWSDPVSAAYLDWTLMTRGGLSGMPESAPRMPRTRDLDATERVLALLPVLAAEGNDSHTTNTSVVDGDGNACVLTTSLGLGSGDFLPEPAVGRPRFHASDHWSTPSPASTSTR